MSAVISADRKRVWRALSDPRELARWDKSRLGAVDAPSDYPLAGQKVLWRSQLGSVRLVMKERLTQVEPLERLAADLVIGSLHLQQLYVLIEEPEDRAQAARTRVSLKHSASNRVHLIGAEVDRFEVRRMLIERIDTTLRALQKWCEN
jgi:hypothetical protein